MVSNKVKRNIWLLLTINGIGVIAARIFEAITGGEWWPILSAAVLTIVTLKMYISYRKAVKEGNLYNKVTPFK